MSDPRPGPRYSEFFRRLRARPLSSWTVGERTASARSAAVDLAALGWTVADGPVPPVPDLGPHALADQLQLLTADAVAADADAEVLDAIIRTLARRLGIRPD